MTEHKLLTRRSNRYAAALTLVIDELRLQRDRRGSLLFTSELRRWATDTLERIVDPSACLKEHDEAKDAQIRDLRSALADAGRKLLTSDDCDGEANALIVARHLGYDGAPAHNSLKLFLSGAGAEEPAA